MSLNLPIQAKVWARATLRDPGQHLRQRRHYECPCCGYKGHFPTASRRRPVPFRCPNCESRPRDRQISLWLSRSGVDLRGASIIHFAPEWPLFRLLRNEPGYVGGDIIRRRNANAIVDIVKIAFPDNAFDYLICNHVLEHVPDDATAMAECFRVMRSGAVGIFTVPISDRAETWEPPPSMPKDEIEKICGWDHKRRYGNDFPQKLERAGFAVEPFRCSAEDQQRYCLLDETVFIARKL